MMTSRSLMFAATLPWIASLASTSALAQQPRCEIDFGAILQHNQPIDTVLDEERGGSSAHFGSHGQLVFGEDVVYLHHLPFLLDAPEHHPHNFQVLLRISFFDETEEQAYLEHRKMHPERLYTALPEQFDQGWLHEIFKHDAEGQELLQVDFFDEHFENSPRPQPFLVADLQIAKVMQFRELDPSGEPATQLNYMIVDGEQEAFLVHELSSPPDFDQVLKVSFTPESVGPFNGSLDGGKLRLVGLENGESDRIAAGDQFTCSAHDGTRRMPFDVTVSVDREIYCEAGELSDIASGPAFEGKRACAPR